MPSPKETASEKKPKKDTDATTPVAEKAAETTVVAAPSVLGGNSPRLLVKPHVSEKAASSPKGTYVFDVPVDANKVEIRKAVEALYKVTVASVRTARGIGKYLKRGRIEGRRRNWKKAIVTLKNGQTIDLYEGV
ncbi:50S ribosomal protein L23 [Patescibacteria group bacterium]|nr:50S ribosomal protein L23 [Patescibacteria group bacterium]MBU1448473.1 50S ribosomal protein L23 [Patescibacteria group bacterium]MBU2613116.1 50S ribosomal protein L23 [Patescibacteria group bacterium]